MWLDRNDIAPCRYWKDAFAIKQVSRAIEAVPALAEALRDTNGSVRKAAAAQLEYIGSAAVEAVPALAEALRDSDADVRKSAANTLRSIGPPAISALLEALRDSDADVRKSAANTLGSIGPAAAEAVPALAEALRDTDGSVRKAAAAALWRIHAACALEKTGPAAAEAVPALIEALRNLRGSSYSWSETDFDLCRRAADKLGKIGPAAAEAVPALIEALRGPAVDMRKSAADALGSIGPAAISALVEVLCDSGADVRKSAADALGSIGPAAISALVEVLRDSGADMRKSAADALGSIGPAAAEAVPALAEALRDTDGSVRKAAAAAFWRIHAACALEKTGPAAIEAVPALAEAFRNLRNLRGSSYSWSKTDFDLCRRAADKLGKIGPAAAEAVPALMEALYDTEDSPYTRGRSPGDIEYYGPDPVLARYAGEALEGIGGAAVPGLIEVMRDVRARGDVRESAVFRLGKIGPAAAEAVPALVEALRDSHRDTRVAAAVALGQIGSAAPNEVLPALKALGVSDRSRAADMLKFWGHISGHTSSIIYDALCSAGPQDFAIFRDIDALWCPEMVVLSAPGTFLMGEDPQHWVTIAYRFAIGRYPVTFDEYDHFCVATNQEKLSDSGWGRGRRPVIHVDWKDGKAYAEWLAKETGKSYRLPSEAEWEYACRAGTTTRYWCGDTITNQDAKYGEWFGKTTKVGSYSPNPWGLYDTHGNVWEWVEDVWHDSYEGAPADGAAWTDREGKESSSNRVLRGGSWGNFARDCGSAFRRRNRPVIRDNTIGFRVARTLD